MTDGPTQVTDLDKTEPNKSLVRSFVEDILVNGRMDRLGGYFDGDNYVQHNPQIADNLSGLGAAAVTPRRSSSLSQDRRVEFARSGG